MDIRFRPYYKDPDKSGRTGSRRILMGYTPYYNQYIDGSPRFRAAATIPEKALFEAPISVMIPRWSL